MWVFQCSNFWKLIKQSTLRAKIWTHHAYWGKCFWEFYKLDDNMHKDGKRHNAHCSFSYVSIAFCRKIIIWVNLVERQLILIQAQIMPYPIVRTMKTNQTSLRYAWYFLKYLLHLLTSDWAHVFYVAFVRVFSYVRDHQPIFVCFCGHVHLPLDLQRLPTHITIHLSLWEGH